MGCGKDFVEMLSRCRGGRCCRVAEIAVPKTTYITTYITTEGEWIGERRTTQATHGRQECKRGRDEQRKQHTVSGLGRDEQRKQRKQHTGEKSARGEEKGHKPCRVG